MTLPMNREAGPLRTKNRIALALLLLLCGGATGSGLAAGPAYWDWPSDRPFSELQMSGTALDRDGHLTAGPVRQVVTTGGAEVFWLAIPDGENGFFTGTGHGGEIYHTTADGHTTLLVQLEATEVFSLLVLPDGDLLAGCGPEGQVFRVDARGRSRLLGSVSGGYVWGLEQGADPNDVWLAAGSPAALYHLDADSGELSEWVSLPAENVMAVHVAPDGSLLLATQGPGLVYRLGPDRELRLLLETPQDEARAFIVGPQRDLFLLALQASDAVPTTGAGRGVTAAGDKPPLVPSLASAAQVPHIAPAALYRIAPDGAVVPWWSGRHELNSVAWSSRWGWLAGGELSGDDGQTTVQRLYPPSGSAPLARWAGGDVVDIMVPSGSGQEVVVCQAHPGGVHLLRERGEDPRVALSPPLDAGQVARWGRLRWSGAGDTGGLSWSVRVGNRSEPDPSWTDWSKPWSEADHALDLPARRFLQWRVEFPAATGRGDAGRVTAVSASAWRENLAPVITDFRLEQLQDVRLGGLMVGGDNVTQRFKSGLQAEFSRNAVANDWAGPTRGSMGRSIRVFTWQASDPNGDRLSYRLAYRQRGETAWRPVSISRPGVPETHQTLASWETTTVPDGSYELELVASDRRDNPATEAAEAVRRIGPVLVDNTPPVIKGFAVEANATGFVVRCRATDRTSVLADARLQLPDGSLERIDPVDRICDSRSEEFDAPIVWPRPGVAPGETPWRVRLEVRDLGGNIAAVAGEAR